MSELINNREYRKKALKEIIKELHDGKPVEEVKAKFDAIVEDLPAGELSAIEQSLINEGLPVTEVQRLCDVHSAVFKGALEKNPDVKAPPGHPIATFVTENKALRTLMAEIQNVLGELKADKGDGREIVLKLAEKLNLLWDIDKHYSRKENLLFPLLEKYEITGPPQVMWGVDDEIRALLKKTKALAVNYRPADRDSLLAKAEETLRRMDEMIFKEEKILLPMAYETLSEDDWYRIYQDSDEIGYCLVEPDKSWKPARIDIGGQTEKAADEAAKGHIRFDTGALTPREISLILNNLPVDVTFVDKEGMVKYFSAGKERIFARTRTIIGRKVENCHPPASVHVVEKLVEDFKSGKKDSEDFWINFAGKYVLIRYFALRDEDGNYAGTMEVTQDIKPLQAIKGEKRIMD